MPDIKNLPYMNYEEICHLTTYISRDTNLLEIGCGSSTLYFSKIVNSIVSIEHDKKWSEQIAKELNYKAKCKWKIHLISPNFPQTHTFQPAQPGQFENYLKFIKNLDADQFDVILVDGRDRVNSAVSSMHSLKSGGILIMHDFWYRPRYHSLLKNQEIELIEEYNSFGKNDNTLAVFRKK
jgi:predicted O-methyltransferase YrrM